MKIYKAVEMCSLIFQNIKILKMLEIKEAPLSLVFFRILVGILCHLQITVFFENL